jgi:hypothetical protein
MKIKIKRMLPSNQIRATASSSINEEKRTVDLTWTTGAKGLRNGWGGPYYEELSLDPAHVDMSRLNDGAHPLLAAHNDRSLDDVVGVIERAEIKDGMGVATVRFAKDEKSDRVFQKIKDGILRNVSVGYSVQNYDETTKEGDEYPTYLATRWTPMEISIVPIGFDKEAKVRNHELQTENEVEILTRSEKTKETPAMDEIEKKRLEQLALDNARKEAATAERTRASEIRKAVKEANLDDKLAQELIDNDSTVEAARTNIALFAKYAKEQAATQVASAPFVFEVGTDEVEKKRDALIESFLVRVDGQNFKLGQGNPFAGMTVLRALEEAGLVKRRPGMSEIQMSRVAMSSSDLPYILANVAEKSAQKKYDLQPRTWSRWAKTDTLRNFKQADRVRSGDFASLEERQESGEFKRGSFGEEREQVTMKEYGKIMAFTRRMLINDDLSEIAKVAAQSGVAASRLENQLVYAQLSSNPNMGDGVALFHASHANLGTAAALTDTQIGEAFKLMRKQTSVDGLDNLNLAPKYLITGPENEVAARKYLSQISPTSASNVNVFSSSLELIIDGEISTDDYFFAADQNAIDTVVLFHLEGEERPRVESRIDFESEELEIKCAHSCVAKAMDWRGLVKNAGAT